MPKAESLIFRYVRYSISPQSGALPLLYGEMM
ncbi:hypothetical protein ABIC84_003211 [Mucilaginibacter sp. 3215]